MLTVIVPIYNSEKYLEKCLSSLLLLNNQDVEILLIDDGSSDKSAIICKKYEEENENFFYYYKENGGPSSARNYGLEKAKGDWITFVDSDDWIISDVYRILLTKLESKFDILYFQRQESRFENIKCLSSLEKDKKILKTTLDIEEIKSGLLNSDRRYIRNLIKQGFWFHGPGAKFYQKKIIEKNHIRFPENLNWGEDICFNMQYLHNANNCAAYFIKGYAYRVHEESLTNSYAREKNTQMLEFCKHMKNIIGEDSRYEKDYCIMGMRQLLFAMKIDFFNKNNTLSYEEKKNKVQLFVNGEPIKSCVKCCQWYKFRLPISIAALLVKKQCYKILYILFKVLY